MVGIGCCIEKAFLSGLEICKLKGCGHTKVLNLSLSVKFFSFICTDGFISFK